MIYLVSSQDRRSSLCAGKIWLIRGENTHTLWPSSWAGPSSAGPKTRSQPLSRWVVVRKG